MAKSVYERFGKTVISGTTNQGLRHKIRGGDTLPMIAAKYDPEGGYSSEYWRQIWEANKFIIEDVDNLVVGAVISVPSLKPTDT